MPTIEELKAAAEALQKGPPRKELTKESDAANVMKQIKALESQSQDGSTAPPLSQVEPPAPVPQSALQSPPPPTSLPTAPHPTPDWAHNVVQVTSRETRHYGQLFQLGDIKAGRAHGYILKEHGGREFITVNVDQIITIGPSKIKAGRCCSDQWAADHREVRL